MTWVELTRPAETAPRVDVVRCRIVRRHWWAVCSRCKEREIWNDKARAVAWGRVHRCES